jgi:hypothetical protein
MRIVFFEESAASCFEMAVDHFLDFDLTTERECRHVRVLYVDDHELRSDLLESAKKDGRPRSANRAAVADMLQFAGKHLFLFGPHHSPHLAFSTALTPSIA